MLISIGYMCSMLCAPLDWQYAENCPRQLAMQSCVLCSFVRCGSSNKIEKKKKKKKKKNGSKQHNTFCGRVINGIMTFFAICREKIQIPWSIASSTFTLDLGLCIFPYRCTKQSVSRKNHSFRLFLRFFFGDI